MNRKIIKEEEERQKNNSLDLINEVISLLNEYSFVEEYLESEEKNVYVKAVNDFYVIVNHCCQKDTDPRNHYFKLYISKSKNHSSEVFFIDFFNRPYIDNYTKGIAEYVRDAHKRCFFYLMHTNKNFYQVNDFLHEYADMEKTFLRNKYNMDYVKLFPYLKKEV